MVYAFQWLNAPHVSAKSSVCDAAAELQHEHQAARSVGVSLTRVGGKLSKLGAGVAAYAWAVDIRERCHLRVTFEPETPFCVLDLLQK